MAYINQTIPAQHIAALLRDGYYFAPCRSFVDLMEFRYGYCLFNTTATESNIEACVRRTFEDRRINGWIDSTCVSCWVTNPAERFAMWEVYGKRGPAIRISVDADGFCQHVRAQGHHTAFGRVTYAGQTSMVRPQFLAKQDLTDEEDAIHHLFFTSTASTPGKTNSESFCSRRIKQQLSHWLTIWLNL